MKCNEKRRISGINKTDKMIFLGTFGEEKSKMLLFRHPKGYKETFLKSSIGIDIELMEVKG